ncbi:hypothetical protein HHK36_008960 [Tetracentron sinense]|uniref:Nucleolar complex protein 2 homolog n=1 Tax=Tetracentron sinense TaxID=13715 RepID=A0A835DHX1_TETSI|nr:hypothetical protein HHK36_008960 [Tetracentron sinense]
MTAKVASHKRQRPRHSLPVPYAETQCLQRSHKTLEEKPKLGTAEIEERKRSRFTGGKRVLMGSEESEERSSVIDAECRLDCIVGIQLAGKDMSSDDEFPEEEGKVNSIIPKTQRKAREHMNQLQRLQEKDPEFYQFLKDHDKELLEFNDEGIDGDADCEMDDMEVQEDAEIGIDDTEHLASIAEKAQKPSKRVITTAMVDSWCNSISENAKLGAVRSLMRVFRTACHYGDDGEDESSSKFSIMSSSVFNKIMLFVLSKMDGILRGLLKLPTAGGKKETILNMMNTKEWKNYSHLVKSYLGNALHVLNQMTDTEMISFTLGRLRYSAIFLAAFPSLLRKYIKVTLHFWGTGGGALPVVSFLFIRDLCIRLGSDCLDECFKGIYKAYVLSCQFVNATKLQHIQFLGNCVIELYGVDLPTAYQHAFIFIRQLAMILREALNMKTKVSDGHNSTHSLLCLIPDRAFQEAFRKVYEWKFMNCLELWTGAICAYGSEADFRPLAYPLIQIISGVARLVPTARYFPLRLRCARMLNRIAASTGSFIPVSLLLLDMLDMKELNRSPTGGLGKAVDLRPLLKVSKPTLKTRAFQEACVFSVIEEVAEHLAQWSYSVAFFELSFIPAVRLRSFCKSTKIERFRREMRQLIRQIEANSEFTNARRMTISFLPNNPSATSFLEVEKKSGASPLSQYVATLCQRAQQRTDSMVESSVLVGAESSVFGNKISATDEENDTRSVEDGSTVFSSSWLPGSNAKSKHPKEEKKRKKKQQEQLEEVAFDEDVVGDLILSSDEDGSMSDTPSAEMEDKTKPVASKQENKKRFKQESKKWKPSTDLSKKKGHFRAKKQKRERK